MHYKTAGHLLQKRQIRAAASSVLSCCILLNHLSMHNWADQLYIGLVRIWRYTLQPQQKGSVFCYNFLPKCFFYFCTSSCVAERLNKCGYADIPSLICATWPRMTATLFTPRDNYNSNGLLLPPILAELCFYLCVCCWQDWCTVHCRIQNSEYPAESYLL